MSGTGLGVVPNIVKRPVPVLMPCQTHQSFWNRYCCRTEHNDLSGTGSTGGIYRPCMYRTYRVAKNLFSENQKSKLDFDWSECQHVKHGDFDISKILFSNSVFGQEALGDFLFDIRVICFIRS